MPRRVSLPAADELFRNTGGPGVQPSAPSSGEDNARARAASRVPAPGGDSEPTEHATAEDQSEEAEQSRRGTARTPRQTRSAAGGESRTARQGSATGSGGGTDSAGRRPRAARRPSGRERHDEKITVYVSAEELMDLEHARLVLRGEYGLAVDRGRIVREAVAVVLADLESRGDASILVRRLRGR
ncbi:hypothetical protein MTQ01_24105 [Streptomyces sp. XM4193]|uniref:hypothetical protein n=1 Tax=Streptomyces sp. XM4193 TaxID=2929782 RepID=UPI001FFAB121|nr:hypothetical protein [Streptomyces sp. XM4193]MCK1799056.1 hypothetical protein [Streptomyces sp. XM4193]